MKEIRCNKCNKLLMKIEEGALYEIKCPRCKNMNTNKKESVESETNRNT